MKEEAALLLAKADRAVRAARTLLRADDPEFAAGRAYYAMFYVAEALLANRDLRFKKHSAVHSAFGKHFAKENVLDQKFHRWLLNAFDRRITTDYGVEVVIEDDEVERMISRADEFLEAAREYLDDV